MDDEWCVERVGKSDLLSCLHIPKELFRGVTVTILDSNVADQDVIDCAPIQQATRYISLYRG